VVAHLIQKVFLPQDLPHLKPALDAYIALSNLIDCLSLANRGCVTPNMLLQSAERFLALFTASWGFAYLCPKFHWLLHFGDHLEQFKTLIACFVHERKHKLIKRFANDMLNTRTLEVSVMHDCTDLQLPSLCDPDSETCNFEVGLVDPRPAPQKVRDFLCDELGLDPDDVGDEIRVSSSSRFSELGACHLRDVVLIKMSDDEYRAGVVWIHADIAGIPMTLVSVFDVRVMDQANGFAEWEDVNYILVVPTDDIVESLIWTKSGDYIRTLLPRNFC
jgi:hypothetical protein